MKTKIQFVCFQCRAEVVVPLNDGSVKVSSDGTGHTVWFDTLCPRCGTVNEVNLRDD